MKHDLPVTFILVGLFIAAQLIGLATVDRYLPAPILNESTGEIVILHPATTIGEAPHVENRSTSFIYIIIGVLVGTALLLTLMHFKLHSAWKYWFLLSVVITLSVSFGVYIGRTAAIIFAVVLGVWKVFRPNVVVHNLTEVFVYTGVAIVFLPILNLTSAIVMLLLISAYDMYAVWKSKHMVRLATYQSESKVFAGLLIPYGGKGMPKVQAMPPSSSAKTAGKTPRPGGRRNAILGGGDIAFPLLFSSAVLEHILLGGTGRTAALGFSAIVSATTAISLFLLLFFAKKDRFYPAMPFLSAGCFAGLAIVWILGVI